jgi:hypothetical protein
MEDVCNGEEEVKIPASYLKEMRGLGALQEAVSLRARTFRLKAVGIRL